MDHSTREEAFNEALKTKSLPALEKLAQQSGSDFNTFINKPLEDYRLPLIAAVEADAIDLVAYLLDHGAAINREGLGETALSMASQKGNAAMVQVLLAYAPDVNGRVDAGFSALYWAAWQGHTEIVSLLLAAKARVDIKTGDRETPLYAAALRGHFNIVKMLVEKKAKVNMICGDGEETALCAACKGDHPDIVQYLLTQGANPNGIGNETPHDFWSFPLFEACSGTVVKLLIAAGATIQAHNKHLDTALHGLVRRVRNSEGTKREKFLEAMKVLLAHGADPLAQNKNHVNTPLALSDTPDVTALLQKAISNKQVSVEEKQAQPKTSLGEPMFKMAHNCNTEEQVASLITLLRQADPEDVCYKSPGDNDATILHNIINSVPFDHAHRKTPFAPYIAAVALLLEKGADVNAIGRSRKESPLHTAVRIASFAGRYSIREYQEGAVELIQLLITHEASLTATDRDACTPLDLATYGPAIDLLKTHHAAYAALSTEVADEIKQGRMHVFEKGMPLELKDKDGNTPLLIASLKNNTQAIEYLVGAGADVHVRNSKWKNNVLDIACLAGSFDAIRYIVSHVPVDINALDPLSKDTALHYLAAWQPNIYAGDPTGMKKTADELCLWMIQQGAAIDLKNTDGKTATDMARTKKLATDMIKAAKKK